jgi:glycosyltransferase involved in cell wall biosynthesis
MTLAIEEPQQTMSAASVDPRVRSAVAVVVTRFPRLDEPIILREINELERLGQPVVLVALQRERGKVIHEEAKPWLRRAIYTRALSLPILLANLVYAFRHPRRYIELLFRLIVGTISDPVVLLRTLAVFPRSVHLARILRARGVEHVHAHFATDPATAAYIMASVSNLTFSFTVHGPDVFVHRLLMREKISAAKVVRTVSTFNKAFLAGLFPVVSEGKLEVIHGGVNPDVYERAAAEAEHAPPVRIFSVARLTETKGFGLLVDACARLKRSGIAFQCDIAGDGPTRREIEEEIARYDVADCVRLLGPRPQHEVARLLGESDIFVLPSVISYSGQMDGIPVALMEAMATGIPVIAAPISGIPELIEHERSGVLVDVNQPEQIASALRRLIEDPQLRTQMGRRGIERVRRGFDVRKTSAAFIDMIERHEMRRTAPARVIISLDWSKLGTCAVGIRKIEERADGIVAEVTITDGIDKRDVIVRARGAENDAVGEFDMQSRIRERLDALDPDQTMNVRYTVPKPLMVDERHRALVTERAPGRQLRSVVSEARNARATRKRAVPLRRAGTWLRLMQQVTRCDEDGRHVLTAITVLALRDLDLAAAADGTVAKQRDRIAAWLRTMEARIAQQPLAVIGRHGRFIPSNIYVAERRVSVTDFTDFREGLPLEDVAQFLVSLETSTAATFAESGTPALERFFLNGYAGDAPIDEETLQFFITIAALESLSRGGSAEVSRLEQARRRRTLRRLIFRGIS